MIYTRLFYLLTTWIQLILTIFAVTDKQVNNICNIIKIFLNLYVTNFITDLAVISWITGYGTLITLPFNHLT